MTDSVPADATAQAETSAHAYVGNIVAQILLVVYLLFVLLVGTWVAGAGFHDPDTCWLLALGRIIFETGKLPQTDPFSFTFALSPQPFVMYQWLTELILYCCYKIGGLMGVLLFVSVLVLFAFVLIPFAVFSKLGLSRPRSIVLIALGWAGAAFHLLIRPEIFSYLFLSAWLAVLIGVRTKAGAIADPGSTNASSGLGAASSATASASVVSSETNSAQSSSDAEPVDLHSASIVSDPASTKLGAAASTTSGPVSKIAAESVWQSVDWRAVAACSGLMLFWANLHTGFTSGFVVLSILVVFGTIGWLIQSSRGPYPYATMVVAFVCSALATLVNPYGIGLWQYIPRLFFGGFNRTIVELQPLGFADMLQPTWFPFYAVLVLTVMAWIRASKSANILKTDKIASLFLIIWMIGLSFKFRRLISFGSVVLIFECALLTARAGLSAKDDVLGSAGMKLRKLMPVSVVSYLIAIVVALTGTVLVASKPVVPRLPQPSTAFAYPEEIMAYVKEHPLKGKGFNSPQLGDVLIWDSKKVPLLFIDTRFDMYGAELVEQYRKIAGCHAGWEELFDKFDFDWVFVHSNNPIAKVLRSNPKWTVAVEGSKAVLFLPTKPRAKAVR